MVDDRTELVRRSWKYIVSWCEAHAPVTAAALRPPADEGSLAAAQEATGRSWPDQLLTWLRLTDGVGYSFDANVIPTGFLSLGAKEIVGSWRMVTGIATDIFPADEIAEAEQMPAGSMATPFLRPWIPFGDDTGGDLLFVDGRAGPLAGCVAHFEHDNGGFTRAPVWDDIAHMLSNIAEALRAGRWVHPRNVDFDQVRTVADGRLRWDQGPASQWKWSNRPWLTPEELQIEVILRAHSGRTAGDVLVELGVPAEQIPELLAGWDRQEGPSPNGTLIAFVDGGASPSGPNDDGEGGAGSPA